MRCSLFIIILLYTFLCELNAGCIPTLPKIETIDISTYARKSDYVVYARLTSIASSLVSEDKSSDTWSINNLYGFKVIDDFNLGNKGKLIKVLSLPNRKTHGDYYHYEAPFKVGGSYLIFLKRNSNGEYIPFRALAEWSSLKIDLEKWNTIKTSVKHFKSFGNLKVLSKDSVLKCYQMGLFLNQCGKVIVDKYSKNPSIPDYVDQDYQKILDILISEKVIPNVNHLNIRGTSFFKLLNYLARRERPYVLMADINFVIKSDQFLKPQNRF